ncbi:ion transporter [Wenyingzhuangia sp. 2_MG-2023]|uniref:ion transporter n=1 Tax=Wenyingzhuangia sp. 2_MG-2023 TaxID=3062639 RepID=UPI0026E26B2D|nr:ion transporter [Wenyingzhuangia sp. 2_MG-2023]MDO6738268.1 ion transporter [Wenyingzhuangia sp. 2_MG-2023]MDO6802248.1 ion transporter [Wenyingzhuangia sp. 1_MG-2023]
MNPKKKQQHWKERLHEIIYEADTPAGKLFDVVLLILIFISVLVVMLESVGSLQTTYGTYFHIIEWIITILFTIEYLLRVATVKSPLNYIFSVYGLIDLAATLPKYLGLFILNTEALLILRALRLLRVFTILKLVRYVGASNDLLKAIKASRAKIGVFVFAVLILSIVLGTIMYLIEGNANSGFTSIPRSIYWIIVTMTTVGYGDIAPVTALGQFFASIVMIMGYGIIAVPTGIVSSEFSDLKKTPTNTKVCSNCNESKHGDNAKYCHQCGYIL